MTLKGKTMFKDREDAGKSLARKLEDIVNKTTLVMAIPRGGVPVAAQIHQILKVEMDLLISRKLPFPENPEAGFGAVAEDGSVYLIPGILHMVSTALIRQIVAEQKSEIQRRIRVLRGGRQLSDLTNRQVILVDDGIAMGSTVMVSIRCCRNLGAAFVIVAVPVASPRASEFISGMTDQFIVLEKPSNFHAVARFYENWFDLSDRDVANILDGIRLRRHFPEV